MYYNGSSKRVVSISAVSSNSVAVEEVYNTTILNGTNNTANVANSSNNQVVAGSANRATVNLENKVV